MFPVFSFIYDLEKMYDFGKLSKKAFLKSYSYLTEEEYKKTAEELEDIEGYSALTVGKLAAYVLAHPSEFPKGLETPITTGDFETNYTHYGHSVAPASLHSVKHTPAVSILYEMHENEGLL